MVKQVDRSSFDEFIRAGVTLISFWTASSGSPKVQAGIVQSVAERVGNDVNVARVDVARSPRLAKRFTDHGNPCLCIFKDGTMVRRLPAITNTDDVVAELALARDREPTRGATDA